MMSFNFKQCTLNNIIKMSIAVRCMFNSSGSRILVWRGTSDKISYMNSTQVLYCNDIAKISIQGKTFKISCHFPKPSAWAILSGGVETVLCTRLRRCREMDSETQTEWCWGWVGEDLKWRKIGSAHAPAWADLLYGLGLKPPPPQFLSDITNNY